MGGDVDQGVKNLELRFQKEIKDVRTEEDLQLLKAGYLGKKGHLSSFLRSLGELPPEQRPAAGALANELKTRIEESFRDLLQNLSAQKRERLIQAESVDVTLPGRFAEPGRLHPVTQILGRVEEIFRQIGFAVFEGPEMETDFYNFEALNIPADHPARDMQDTFYISQSHLLRTHTSPVQIHVMEKFDPPVRMIAPGAVYRRDSDVTHTPMFHQVEGLVVQEGIRFSDLKGTVYYFLQQFFGESKKIRFRPSYFPFTEPSAEVDIGCVICGGEGKMTAGDPCRVCKSTGWLEVMGCGMVNPAVFEKIGNTKYRDNNLSGFAFGMGIERLAMLKFGIPDIRLFFENDLRFLRQL